MARYALVLGSVHRRLLHGRANYWEKLACRCVVGEVFLRIIYNRTGTLAEYAHQCRCIWRTQYLAFLTYQKQPVQVAVLATPQVLPRPAHSSQ